MPSKKAFSFEDRASNDGEERKPGGKQKRGHIQKPAAETSWRTRRKQWRPLVRHNCRSQAFPHRCPSVLFDRIFPNILSNL